MSDLYRPVLKMIQCSRDFTPLDAATLDPQLRELFAVMARTADLVGAAMLEDRFTDLTTAPMRGPTLRISLTLNPSTSGFAKLMRMDEQWSAACGKNAKSIFWPSLDAKEGGIYEAVDLALEPVRDPTKWLSIPAGLLHYHASNENLSNHQRLALFQIGETARNIATQPREGTP